ncbi:MAG: hypothetical protein JSU65_13850 [Candidatus Zixiibacteriota bacterium]|nr:MAG: hypothetical protein JSU65_13850 [candidate division Zixibacteria bacterium]
MRTIRLFDSRSGLDFQDYDDAEGGALAQEAARDSSLIIQIQSGYLKMTSAEFLIAVLTAFPSEMVFVENEMNTQSGKTARQLIESEKPDDYSAYIGSYNSENVRKIHSSFADHRGWDCWLFGAFKERHLNKIKEAARLHGLLRLGERTDPHPTDYTIFINEDMHEIYVTVFDSKLFDPFIDFADGLAFE